jgi:hypothetical protein
MGVYQHHDAVAGTAKQYVANDYSLNLFNAMQENNELFGRTLTSDGNWLWCQSNNETYIECPIGNH